MRELNYSLFTAKQDTIYGGNKKAKFVNSLPAKLVPTVFGAEESDTPAPTPDGSGDNPVGDVPAPETPFFDVNKFLDLSIDPDDEKEIIYAPDEKPEEDTGPKDFDEMTPEEREEMRQELAEMTGTEYVESPGEITEETTREFEWMRAQEKAKVNMLLRPWDPRLARANSVFVKDSNNMVVLMPFASDTVASCYEDMVFHLPKGAGNYIQEAMSSGQYKYNEYLNQSLENSGSDSSNGGNNASTGNSSTGGDSSSNQQNQNVEQKSEAAKKSEEIEKENIAYLKGLWENIKGQYESQADLQNGFKREHPYGDDNYVVNPDMYGAQSVMNPYSITRLVGAFDDGIWMTDDNGENYKMFVYNTNHLYDVRDSRRFYDLVTTDSLSDNPYGNQEDRDTNVNDILMPTTTNIIKYSNADPWGRTPYTFQDFVFCKYWNIIPNNRLITLRKYKSAVADNLNFPGMKPFEGEDGQTDSYDKLITANKKGIETSTTSKTVNPGANNKFPPIVTLVGYMGDETGNKISNLLSFSAGVNWEEIQGKVHDVDGNEGSDPREVIDNWSAKGSGFFADGGSLDYGNGILSALVSRGGLATSKLVGVNKFVSMFTPGGFRDVSKTSLDKLKSAQMDPQASGPYNNRIEGPLNRIDKVWKRKEGISFGHTIKLKFDYVARPIGGMNTKAVMLDIMANCLMMGASDAVFWGGAHRFNIEYANHYCYSGFNEGNDFMMKLYNGKIFGKGGAIESALTGIKNIGKGAFGGGSGSFDFSNVTSMLGGVLKSALGGLGSILTSAANAIFGEGSKAAGAVAGGVDAVNNAVGATPQEINRGKGWIDSLKNNLNGLWSSKMLQATTFPQIRGFKAILTGEPVGPWHLTVGNPLNPMMVIGNLICKSVNINFSDELGPDDFPLEMSATYELQHGMIRDKAAIESMFNRGCGKIYKLPDYINSVSDFETKVDAYTGDMTDFRKPHFANTPSSTIYNMAGAHGGYFVKNWDNAHTSQNSQDSQCVFTKFIPHDATMIKGPVSKHQRTMAGITEYMTDYGLIPVIQANILQRKTVE